MARQTNDGEPTYGRNRSEKTKETDIRPSHHFSDAAAGQISPARDEPALERARLSEDGSHPIEETLFSTGQPAG